MATIKRACLGCKATIPKGRSYCDRCQADRDKAKAAKRMAEGKRNGSTRQWRALRVAILNRDGHRCTHVDSEGTRCPVRTGLHVDHVVPLARGGSHHPSNLATKCAKHNLAKGTRIETSRASRAAR